VAWTVEFKDAVVEAEFDDLPDDLQARFFRIAQLIEAVGAPFVREPHVKSLGRGLFEIRMQGKDGIARALYVLAKMERVVVVLVFVKKTQRTPNRVIELARERAKEVR
jgi:phage-related protein